MVTDLLADDGVREGRLIVDDCWVAGRSVVGELKAGGAAKRCKYEKSSVQRSWPPTAREEADEKEVVDEGDSPAWRQTTLWKGKKLRQ